jgi:diadenosine tetraphosphate (Ap4A) HIT family hydrolase
LRKSGCTICKDGPLDVIAELDSAWVSAARIAPLPGYACVVAKTHVIQPFDLDDRQSSAFWRDAMIAAKVVGGVFRPMKMNYEIHGNTAPHLHVISARASLTILMQADRMQADRSTIARDSSAPARTSIVWREQ